MKRVPLTRQSLFSLCLRPPLLAAAAILLLAVVICSTLLPQVPALEAGGVETFPTPSPQLWKDPLPQDQKVLHLLDRITFGPRPGDVDRVRAMGIKAFLEEQLHPERIDDSGVEAMLRNLPSYELTNAQMLAEYPPPRPAPQRARRQGATAASQEQRAMTASNMEGGPGADNAAQRMDTRIMGPDNPQRPLVELGTEELWRAAYSNRQLQEVMVQFWMNHFNIYADKGPDRWMLTSFERDVIRPNALGKFQDLLVATAESPAMLFYLDNWMSRVGNPKYERRFTNRPMARPFGEPGMMRPVGRRVFFPRPGPRPFPRQPNRVKNAKQQKPGINENYGRELMELHTLGVSGGYTQKDVIEVARSLTGWTILRPQQEAAFYFNPNMHDWGPKVVLGKKFHAGHGMDEGLKILRMLASNPATAHHISYELCQRFVADNPPKSVVDRAAKTWLKTDGDIRAVLKAILTSPEFYSRAADGAKVKSPFELVASAMRALGAQTDGGLPIMRSLAAMGEPMFQYQAPSGYYDLASTWINSGTLLMRMNFATMLASGRIPGTRVDLAGLVPETADGSPEQTIASLSARILGGPPSAATKQAILQELEKQSTASPPNGNPARQERGEAAAVAGLLIGSPDFQRR